MKIKLNELESRIEKLNSLGAIKLPVELSYAISKNIRLLAAEYKIFSQERQKILEKNCIRDNNGQPIIENKEYTYENEQIKAAALEELKELLDTEAEINAMNVDINTLKRCEDSQKFDTLTVSDVAALDFMIE